MSSGETQQAVCKWCGEKLAEGAEVCPLCRRPTAASELRPIETAEERRPVSAPARPPAPQPRQWERPEEREPVAAGQEDFGSWASIKHILREDKVFGALLVLMALEVLLQVVAGMWTGAIISGAVLWGIVTFRWWGLWIAVVGACLGMEPAVVFAFRGDANVPMLIGLAVNAFVVWVLLARRDMFD